MAFVSFTPESELRKRLQKVDGNFLDLMRRPSMRFIDKRGRRVDREVGAPNPWSGGKECKRKGCLHCQGRAVIAAKKELEAVRKVTGEGDGSEIPKEDMKSLPSCTKEGIIYAVQCYK